MTDPTGCSFLSYRRVRRAEAALLIAAQHDVGVPTWHDQDNLPDVPSEEGIRAVLAGAPIACGLLWLTPEVASSEMIQRVEAPLLLERARRRDGFFLVAVAAGGLDYAAAAATLDGRFNLANLANHNLRKVDSDPIAAADAAAIAARVLESRIAAIHQALPAGKPLRLRLDTRTRLPLEPGVALALDWSERFDGRRAKPGAWDEHLLPALRTISNILIHKAPGRDIEASGFCSIPAATALGSAFLATRPTRLTWVQRVPGDSGAVSEQRWSLDAGRTPSGFRAECVPDDVGGSDLAVLVSVADSVERHFGACRAILPRLRAILTVSRPGATRHLLEGPQQAVDIALVLRDAIREARQAYPPIERIHLFMAVPAGLAVMVGQLLNTLGRVQTYEHVDGESPPYQPAALLRPDA
jgi:SMODS-associated and fused to various effectors sensor domain